MSAVSARGGNGTFWAFLPVLLLTGSLGGVGSMAYVAARDPSFSLERDYYQRAVHWDREQAQAAENQRLGYVLSLKFSGPRGVEVTVTDAEGLPLHGASVRAEGFANARASNIQELSFVEGPSGTYRAELAAPRAGLWEFRFRVQNGTRHFTQVLRADLDPKGTGP